jgi:Pseudouridylate synthases, 23S RNA-specific
MLCTISPDCDGITVREYLRRELGLSHASVTRLKTRERGIVLGGVRVTVRAVLHTGDTLELDDSDYEVDTGTCIIPVDLPFEILYEDCDLLAVNKPFGMPTHPSHGHYYDTLANAAMFYFRSRGIPFVFRAVNRLDRDTSGIVLLAKNKHAAYTLGRAVEPEHSEDGASRYLKIKKEYFAVLRGIINPAEPPCGVSYITTETAEDNFLTRQIADSAGGKQGGSRKPKLTGIIDAPIRRATPSIILREVAFADDAARAVTEFEVISTLKCPPFGYMTLVKAFPRTGRTHQLRVHFAYLGCPIAGDTLYGSYAADTAQPIARQALHCASITLGELRIEAPLPDDIKQLIKQKQEQ